MKQFILTLCACMCFFTASVSQNPVGITNDSTIINLLKKKAKSLTCYERSFAVELDKNDKKYNCKQVTVRMFFRLTPDDPYFQYGETATVHNPIVTIHQVGFYWISVKGNSRNDIFKLYHNGEGLEVL